MLRQLARVFTSFVRISTPNTTSSSITTPKRVSPSQRRPKECGNGPEMNLNVTRPRPSHPWRINSVASPNWCSVTSSCSWWVSCSRGLTISSQNVSQKIRYENLILSEMDVRGFFLSFAMLNWQFFSTWFVLSRLFLLWLVLNTKLKEVERQCVVNLISPCNESVQ